MEFGAQAPGGGPNVGANAPTIEVPPIASGCCQVVWSTAVLGCGKASHGEVGQGAMVCSVT